MRIFEFILSILFTLFFFSGPANALDQRYLNLTGSLSKNGSSISGLVSFKIQVTDYAGTCVLWQETQNSVMVVNGAFSLQLGQTTPTFTGGSSTIDSIFTNGVTLNCMGGGTTTNTGSLTAGRNVNITFDDHSGAGPQILNQQVAIDAVPYAMGALTAQNLTSLLGSSVGIGTGLTNGSVLMYNGSTWIPQTLTGGGSITGVTAGSGLSGGGSAGTVTLNVVGANVTGLNGSNISSGLVSAAFGGTGVAANTASNGSLLIGNGSGFVLNNLTAGSGITITNSAGGITIANTGSGGFTGSGATNYVPLYNGTTSLTSSAISQNTSGSNIGIGTTTALNTLDVNGTGIHLTSGSPVVTTYSLYNSNGNLYWNGSPVTSGGTMGGSGTLNYVPVFSGTTTLGSSNIYTSGSSVGIGTTVISNALDVGSGGIHMTSGTPTNTNLALYSSNGTLYWNGSAVGIGSGGSQWTSSGNNIYNVNSGNIGIGTASPVNAVDISTGQGLRLSAGTPNNTAAALYNIGGALYWNGSAVAIGTSGVSSQWTTNGSNINYSTGYVGIGSPNPSVPLAVTGSAAISGGLNVGSLNSNVGTNSTALGYNNYTAGNYGLASGSSNTVSGNNYATALGYGNYVYGDSALATGGNLKAYAYESVVIGQYNVGNYNSKTSWVGTDPVFEVGIGSSGGTADAMTILKNGAVGIGTATPAISLDILAMNPGTVGIGTGTFYAGERVVTQVSGSNGGASVIGIVQPQAGSQQIAGIVGMVDYSQSSGGASGTAIMGQENISGGTVGGPTGITGQISMSAGSASNLTGMNSQVSISGGTVGNATGVSVNLSGNTGVGYAGMAQGLNVQINDSGSSFTGSTGIYIGNIQSSAGHHYSIVANDSTSPSYFMANVGVGTNNPQVTLDVAGGIRPGSSGVTTGSPCSAEGTFAYDMSAHAPVFCNSGLMWASMGSGGPTPNGLTFANLTGQSIGFPNSSAPVTLTWPGGGYLVASCTNCAGISVNGGSFTLDPVIVISGDTISVSINPPNAWNSTSPNATVTVGNSSATWNTTTGGFNSGVGFVAYQSGSSNFGLSGSGTMGWATNALAYYAGATYGAPTSLACSGANCTAIQTYMATGFYSNNYGITWSTTTLPSAGSWSSVACSGSYCVAVQTGGSNSAAYSTNYGSSWTSTTMPSSSSWTGATCNGANCIAVANGATAAYSSNGGLSWVAKTMPTSASWTSTSCSGTYCVSVANGTATGAYSSNNGSTWSASTLPSSGAWNSVSCSSNFCFAVQQGTSSGAYSSNYGSTWSSVTLPMSAYSVSCSGSTCVAMGSSNNSAAYSNSYGASGSWTSIPVPYGLQSIIHN